MSDAPERPVAPKDAGTLILVRQRAGATEVLMGRRQSRMAFMPGAFVFPGGKVDAADRAAAAATPLGAVAEVYLTASCDAATASALAKAAVRETFEETGLLLGKPGDVGDDVGGSWARIRETGLAPALDALSYVGRAITPPESPIRFHARFFVADAEGCSGSLAGSGELLDLHWTSLEEAVQLPIADVTHFMLAEVERQRAPQGGDDGRRALFTYRGDTAVVRYDTP